MTVIEAQVRARISTALRPDFEGFRPDLKLLVEPPLSLLAYIAVALQLRFDDSIMVIEAQIPDRISTGFRPDLRQLV